MQKNCEEDLAGMSCLSERCRLQFRLPPRPSATFQTPCKAISPRREAAWLLGCCTREHCQKTETKSLLLHAEVNLCLLGNHHHAAHYARFEQGASSAETNDLSSAPMVGATSLLLVGASRYTSAAFGDCKHGARAIPATHIWSIWALQVPALCGTVLKSIELRIFFAA